MARAPISSTASPRDEGTPTTVVQARSPPAELRPFGSPLCQVRSFGALECAPVLVAVKTSDASNCQAATVDFTLLVEPKAVGSS